MPAKKQIKNPNSATIFFTSILLLLAVVLTAFLIPDTFTHYANITHDTVRALFGWFYLSAAFLFLLAALFFAFGPYGQIKLGQDDDEPEYSYFSWLAMLFSAGMGIGLVFYGVAEPMLHFANPPSGMAEPESTQAARLALRFSFFHWGLHPWAIYTVIGLAIAYSRFRRLYAGGLISAIFRPIFKDRVDGPLGQAIEIFATIATAIGVATSLGLGASQISGGLSYLFDIPNSVGTKLTIIAIVTVLYIASASTGLNRGILYLSNLNLTVAAFLLAFLFMVGPTGFILDVFTTTLGDYLGNLIAMSFRMTPFSGSSWTGDWTIFYWAWWIAWAPFVGAFIARISRGRTIQEFVLTVLLVPTILGALWFSVFGGSALYLELFEGVPIAAAVSADLNQALFITLGQFPYGAALSLIATLLIMTFFITSADSATFVLGMLSTGGSLNPSLRLRVIWGAMQSSIAAALLVSGGLQGLQTASIVAALPFTVIMIGIVIALRKDLRADLLERRGEEKRERQLFRKWKAAEVEREEREEREAEEASRAALRQAAKKRGSTRRRD